MKRHFPVRLPTLASSQDRLGTFRARFLLEFPRYFRQGVIVCSVAFSDSVSLERAGSQNQGENHHPLRPEIGPIRKGVRVRRLVPCRRGGYGDRFTGGF